MADNQDLPEQDENDDDDALAASAPDADDDASPADSSDTLPTSAAAPSLAAGAIPQSPAPINPIIAAYLQNKQEMAQAQQTASQNQLIAGLARASGTLAHSAPMASPSDPAPYDVLDRNAQAPVQNLLAKQKAGMQGVEDQQTLSSLVSNQSKIQAEADPNSPNSKIAQQMASDMLPKMKDQFANMPASQILSALPQLKGVYDVQMKHLDRQEKTQEMADANSERQNEADQRLAIIGQKTTDQMGGAQDKAYTSMRKDLETFRGNQSAQQAALAVQNGQKALALTNSEPTSQNLNLLADEMGKLASGGVPGEHGTQALLPNNLNTKLAQMKAFITSNPSSADVKQYLDNNRDYVNQVMEVSKDTLGAYRSNIAKGYRNRVKPEDFQEAADDYGLNTSGPTNASSGGLASGSQTVQIKDPTGKVRQIPLAQKNAALQAGGQLVQPALVGR